MFAIFLTTVNKKYEVYINDGDMFDSTDDATEVYMKT